jgi:hypothetical protein
MPSSTGSRLLPMLEEERGFEKVAEHFSLQMGLLFASYNLTGTLTIKICTEALRSKPRRSDRV